MKNNKLKITFNEINTKTIQDNEIVIDISLYITDLINLKNVIKDIKKIESVYDVKRLI